MAKERREGRQEALRVAVRCCPGRDKNLVIKQEENSFELQRPKTTLKKSFKFEKVWGASEISTDPICDGFSSPAIRTAVCNGEHIAVLSFGASKTGKTTTMRGPKGVMRRTASDVFEAVQGFRNAGDQVMVSVTALMSVVTAPVQSNMTGRLVTHEVLLDAMLPDGGGLDYKGGLVVREHPTKGFFVEGLTEVCVDDEKECLQWVGRALENFDAEEARCGTAGGPLRVHCLVTLRAWIRQADGNEIVSDVQLVDLAGWQRPEKSTTSSKNPSTKDYSKAVAFEDIVIKAVMRVTDSLEQKTSHVPYRDSKLTRLLQKPLGVNGNCMVVLHVGQDSYEETEAMLQYGQKLSNIELRVSRNAVDYFAQQQGHTARIQELCHVLKKDPKSLKSYGMALNLGSSDQDVELRDHVSASERLAEEASAWDKARLRSNMFKEDGGAGAERLDRKPKKCSVKELENDGNEAAAAAQDRSKHREMGGGSASGATRRTVAVPTPSARAPDTLQDERWSGAVGAAEGGVVMRLKIQACIWGTC